ALAASEAAPALLPDRAFDAVQVEHLFEAGATALCSDLTGFVEHYRAHPDPARRLGDGPRLAACVRSHLRRTQLAARAAGLAAEHEPLRAALEAATLCLPGVTYA